jgi:hypothetical protein
MYNRSRLLVAGITAAFVFSMAIGSASANRLSTSAQDIDMRWSNLIFSSDAGSSVTCPITLQGSFHSRTLGKVVNGLIGFVSRGSVRGQNSAGNCTGGTGTVLTATLPWHITYRSFQGTLPNITGVKINLIGTSFQIQPEGSLTCLARATTTNPMVGTVNLSSGRATSLSADPSASIPLTGSGGFCAFGGEGHFEGTTSSVTRLASTASITITLI